MDARLLPARRCCALIVVAAGLLGGAGRARAQAVSGRITDGATQRGVSSAGVFLLDAARRPVASAPSDSAGRFHLALPSEGAYSILVRALGYEDLLTPLLALAGADLPDLELALHPEPVGLEGLTVRVRNERVERWLTESLGVSPHNTFGYRLIQGPRLEEARLRSRDGIDFLRWFYLPVFNRPDGLCIGLYLGGCADYYVDGQALPPELLETLDLESVAAVVVLPPDLHVITRRFDWAPFFRMPIRR